MFQFVIGHRKNLDNEYTSMRLIRDHIKISSQRQPSIAQNEGVKQRFHELVTGGNLMRVHSCAGCLAAEWLHPPLLLTLC